MIFSNLSDAIVCVVYADFWLQTHGNIRVYYVQYSIYNAMPAYYISIYLSFRSLFLRYRKQIA